jgi:uncharacterized membrane protein YozB (DUF420 family)
MGILTWTLLFILNAILTIANYKIENYKTAMLSSFTAGMALFISH